MDPKKPKETDESGSSKDDPQGSRRPDEQESRRSLYVIQETDEDTHDLRNLAVPSTSQGPSNVSGFRHPAGDGKDCSTAEAKAARDLAKQKAPPTGSRRIFKRRDQPSRERAQALRAAANLSPSTVARVAARKAASDAERNAARTAARTVKKDTPTDAMKGDGKANDDSEEEDSPKNTE